MSLDPQKLSERLAELSKVYQKQQEKYGAPGYDPSLLQLLHKDITELKAQLETKSQIENR